ncbi:MAG: zinc ABC transporter substrate-binding protein [Paracoccaceae bacterium]
MLQRTLFAILLAAIPTLAPAQALRVMTDIPVTQSLVAKVMQGVGEPAVVLERGGDPHHLQLRPSQVRDLARADLVVVMSHALSPWMETATAMRDEGTTLELAMIDGTHRLALGEDEHDDHDHGHEGHDHEEHDHDAAGYDPHLWLDIDNAILWVQALAAEFARRDPANAETYARNAESAAANSPRSRPKSPKPLLRRGAIRWSSTTMLALISRTHDLTVAGTISGTDDNPGAARLSLRESLGPTAPRTLSPGEDHPR